MSTIDCSTLEQMIRFLSIIKEKPDEKINIPVCIRVENKYNTFSFVACSKSNNKNKGDK